MFITSAIAKDHLRIAGDDGADDLDLKSAAAEQAVVDYLDRAVFADQAALVTAVAQVPGRLAAAKLACLEATAAAQLVADMDLRQSEQAYAEEVYLKAAFAAARTRRGILINPAILSAMLLMLGDLWENREDTAVGVSVSTMPNGIYSLLVPYRHQSL